MKKSFNIQELLHHKSKRHGIKPMHPYASKAFRRHQEHDLKHPSLMDLITTKQNKLHSFIDRWALDKIKRLLTPIAYMLVVIKMLEMKGVPILEIGKYSKGTNEPCCFKLLLLDVDWMGFV
jgi:hypothetical protein